jgi:hypothetical protein
MCGRLNKPIGTQINYRLGVRLRAHGDEHLEVAIAGLHGGWHGFGACRCCGGSRWPKSELASEWDRTYHPRQHYVERQYLRSANGVVIGIPVRMVWSMILKIRANNEEP